MKKKQHMVLLEKDYDGQQVYNLDDDVSMAFNPMANPSLTTIPVNEWGYLAGKFRLTIEWFGPEEIEEHKTELE